MPHWPNSKPDKNFPPPHWDGQSYRRFLCSSTPSRTSYSEAVWGYTTGAIHWSFTAVMAPVLFLFCLECRYCIRRDCLRPQERAALSSVCRCRGVTTPPLRESRHCGCPNKASVRLTTLQTLKCLGAEWKRKHFHSDGKQNEENRRTVKWQSRAPS